MSSELRLEVGKRERITCVTQISCHAHVDVGSRSFPDPVGASASYHFREGRKWGPSADKLGKNVRLVFDDWSDCMPLSREERSAWEHLKEECPGGSSVHTTLKLRDVPSAQAGLFWARSISVRTCRAKPALPVHGTHL